MTSQFFLAPKLSQASEYLSAGSARWIELYFSLAGLSAFESFDTYFVFHAVSSYPSLFEQSGFISGLLKMVSCLKRPTTSLA